MTVTKEALLQVDQHWAIAAVGRDRHDRALEVSKIRFVRSAIGQQLAIDFAEAVADDDTLERLATAYEIAAIEGMDSLLHPSSDNVTLQQQAQAGAYRAYALLCTAKVPASEEERVFRILHLAALAYCGDRWTDLRRWVREHPQEVVIPSIVDSKWDKRLLFRLFDCWLRLFRKDGWDDLDGIRKIVAELRTEQEQYEHSVLENQDNDVARAIALRLIALYHWARATELLATYTLQGEPVGILAELDQHFESAVQASRKSQDPAFEVLMRWLHVAGRRMVAGSIWWVAQAVNGRVTRFITRVTKSRALFELLPPQRAALLEQGLLDQASRAIIVDLPTSGGKTALAQFRMLQALNQFDADHGWVAYVAPTRALVAQVTRRLREDFSPLNIRVEQLSGAVEIDNFEDLMLKSTANQPHFDILVATPEKLQLVIRGKSVARPLALIVMDEAHNIEDEERGLRIELLLATIKRDCPRANFLLLMPNVPNAADLAKWLAPDSGRTISLGTSAWQPNERIVGMFESKKNDSVRGGWTLNFETLTTSPKTIELRGKHQVGGVKPLQISFSKAKGLSTQAGAMAKVFAERGTSIAVAQTIPDAWSMAKKVAADLPAFQVTPPEIALVQRFLTTEMGSDFELIGMLDKGIGVHHAGLSDETRILIEWLAETGKLRVLCATTTIAQGLNFPVSSVFLATKMHPYGNEMTKRGFWNLAGRAGRIDHDSIGVIGIASGNKPDEIRRYVSDATGELVSRLAQLLDQVEKAGKLNNLNLIIQEDQWMDYRCYVAHLWAEKQNLDAVLAETEQLLRNTFGFGWLQAKSDNTSRRKTQALLDATKQYARDLAGNPAMTTLADATGFDPEGVTKAVVGLNRLERKLTSADWEPSSLFGVKGSSTLPKLIGVMMQIPQLRKGLDQISSSGKGHAQIAKLATAWVTGKSIKDIAKEFFSASGTPTDAVTDACRAIYRELVNSGPWGMAALSKLPSSGINFDKLSDDEKRRLNSLPAMIYHGVQTEEAILMRMNSVPRSVAESLGREFSVKTHAKPSEQNVTLAATFLRSLQDADWDRVRPKDAAMTGSDYREVWQRLSGETS